MSRFFREERRLPPLANETGQWRSETASVFGGNELRGQPGCVLKDTFRAGVVDELFASDEAFLHLDSAPGAESIGKVRRGSFRRGGHGRHCVREPQTLSTE